jgi:hypothetical protein
MDNIQYFLKEKEQANPKFFGRFNEIAKLIMDKI